MTETIDELIAFLNDTKLKGKMIFGLATESDSSFDLTYTRLNEQVVDKYRKSFKRKLAFKKKLPHSQYSPTETEPAGYATYKVADLPQGKELIKLPTTKTHGFDKHFIKKIRFTAFRLEGDNQVAYFFRVYQHTKFLTKSKWDTLVFQGDVLSFAENDMIVASPAIDFVVFGDNILIFRIYAFEKLFKLMEAYHAHADEVFTFFETNKSYTIRNLQAIRDACDGLPQLRRLSNISKQTWYKSLTIEVIEQFAKTSPDAGITVDIAQKTVAFTSPDKFLSFYNDDYVQSEVTSDKYLAYAKKRRS